MFHKDTPMTLSLTKAIAIVWLIFTTLYFLLSITIPMIAQKVEGDLMSKAQLQGQQEGYNLAMQSLSGNVFQNGYTNAIGQLVGALGKQINDGCKDAVPVQIGTGSVGIVSVPCLQKIQEAAQTQTGSTQVQK